jgi:thiol-disulfide isomerase/thioredoxin
VTRTGRRRRPWLELALAVLLIGGVYAWRTAPLLPGDGDLAAPEWSLSDTAGRRWSGTDFAGRTTVLYFFAPWCAVCNASAHQLRWFERWSGDGAALVLIALDYDTPTAVVDYAERHGLDGPVLLGDPETAAAFRIYGYPTYYVVNGDGRIVSRDFGYTTLPGLWARTLFNR